jgi:hypothetical protein
MTVVVQTLFYKSKRVRDEMNEINRNDTDTDTATETPPIPPGARVTAPKSSDSFRLDRGRARSDETARHGERHRSANGTETTAPNGTETYLASLRGAGGVPRREESDIRSVGHSDDLVRNSLTV